MIQDWTLEELRVAEAALAYFAKLPNRRRPRKNKTVAALAAALAKRIENEMQWKTAETGRGSVETPP